MKSIIKKIILFAVIVCLEGCSAHCFIKGKIMNEKSYIKSMNKVGELVLNRRAILMAALSFSSYCGVDQW